jgi:hypothetical protein
MSSEIGKNVPNSMSHYTFEKIAGQKLLNVKEGENTVAQVAAHNLRFHRGAVKVETNAGRFYVKQADFDAAIHPHGIKVTKSVQSGSSAAQNNNNNNQDLNEAIKENPLAVCRFENQKAVEENPQLFKDAVLLQYIKKLESKGEKVSEEQKGIFKARLEEHLAEKPSVIKEFCDARSNIDLRKGFNEVLERLTLWDLDHPNH